MSKNSSDGTKQTIVKIIGSLVGENEHIGLRKSLVPEYKYKKEREEEKKNEENLIQNGQELLNDTEYYKNLLEQVPSFEEDNNETKTHASNVENNTPNINQQMQDNAEALVQRGEKLNGVETKATNLKELTKQFASIVGGSPATDKERTNGQTDTKKTSRLSQLTKQQPVLPLNNAQSNGAQNTNPNKGKGGFFG